MIVWLASYPGSGNKTLSNLLERFFRVPTHSRYEVGREALSALAQSPELHCVTTHDAPEDTAKAIYLVRHPSAALGSYQSELEHSDGNSLDLLEIIAGCTKFGAWPDHVSAWNPHERPGTLLVKFEELCLDPQTAIREIGEFLKLEPTSTDNIDIAELHRMAPEIIPVKNSENNGIADTAQELINALYSEEMSNFGYANGSQTGALRVRQMLKELSSDLSQSRSEALEAAHRAENVRHHYLDAQREIRVKDAEIARTRQSEAELSGIIEEMGQQLGRAHDRLGQLHDALTPRWQTILTLKPLRFVFRTRQLMKSGALRLDEHGIPIRPETAESPPLSKETHASPVPLSQAKKSLRPGASSYAGWTATKPLGIAVFAYDRVQNLEAVLESLKLQDALSTTHVFIDGDQGRPAKRQILDRTEEVARSYEIAGVHRQRGNFGFRKMMILSMKRMFDKYEHALFLEDDCFPTRHAVNGMSFELNQIENDDSLFSVYGHHFGMESGADSFPRFQGWGWATTRDKMMAIWPDLRDCYLMHEDEYLNFVAKNLTPDVKSRLDATPGRDPLDTITKFFAWDETLTLLTAAKGLSHRPSRERLIYNCGIGHGSTHFGMDSIFREPPFNMISPDEVWKYF